MSKEELDTHRILHHLDDPLRLLKWTLDEAAVFLTPFFAGVLLNQLFVGFVLSVIGLIGIRKLKSKYGNGTLKHFLYWYFPHNKKRFKKTPPSYMREFLG